VFSKAFLLRLCRLMCGKAMPFREIHPQIIGGYAAALDYFCQNASLKVIHPQIIGGYAAARGVAPKIMGYCFRRGEAVATHQAAKPHTK
jgi:hypothetical protein